MDFAVSLSHLQAACIAVVITMSFKHSYVHFAQDLGAQHVIEKNITKQHWQLFSTDTHGSDNPWSSFFQDTFDEVPRQANFSMALTTRSRSLDLKQVMMEEILTSWYGKCRIIYMALYIPGGAGFLQKDGVSPKIALLRPVIKPKFILRKDPSSIYFPVVLLRICMSGFNWKGPKVNFFPSGLTSFCCTWPLQDHVKFLMMLKHSVFEWDRQHTRWAPTIVMNGVMGPL